jgi:hypothetical protein
VRGQLGRDGLPAGVGARLILFPNTGVLSATPLTYSLRRDDHDFVVFFW